MTGSLLLQGGIALIHQENDDIVAQKVDILISDGKIAKIGESLDGAGAEVIDCKGKLISPGFVDGHHHCWQTQLKGRHGNHMLHEYLPTGNQAGYLFKPEDVYLGELGSMLELIDSGVTTVVDHCHIIYSEEHADQAIKATVESGIRSIFCYATTFRVAEWTKEKCELEPNPLTDWFMAHFLKIASQQYANGRVEIGFGYDLYAAGEQVNKKIFKTVRDAGAKLITSHWVSKSPIFHSWAKATVLEEQQLAGPDLLISHCNQLDDESAAMFQKHGISMVSTPMTELQVGLGLPVCYDPRFSQNAGLGVDCHTSGAGDMITQMRVSLQAERGIYNQKFIDQGKNPWTCKQTVQQAFNLATIKGARAAKLGDRVGSIAVGKAADFVIFDGETPAMICGAREDPVAAIVLHSSIRDIDTVIVDGVVKKIGGKLLPIETEAYGKLSWKGVALKLEESHKAIMKRQENVSFEVAFQTLAAAMKLDWDNFPKV